MIDENKIIENKERVIQLVSQINRDGADIEGLLKKLNTSDFFIAPASTMYHCAYRGGLCQHSLNVYDNLVKLNETKQLGFLPESMIIVALFHDFSKMNFYETSLRNVKDEYGEWVQVPYIKMKDSKDRFIYAGHGTNSEFMIRRFIPLKLEESVAIINHMGGKDIVGGGVSDAYVPEIFSKYPLALYLHLADMMSSFGDEIER